MLFGVALWRAGFLLAAACADALWPVLSALVIFEVGTAARQPIVTAWLNEHVGEDLRATVLSVGGMAFMLGGSLGLVAIGGVARTFGIPAAWLVCAALFAVMAPLYLVLGRVAAREETRPREDRPVAARA